MPAPEDRNVPFDSGEIDFSATPAGSKPQTPAAPVAITRSDLTDAVLAVRQGTSRQYARQIVDAVINNLADALCNGDEVRLRGFGRFNTRWKSERPGRNPATMQPATISARCVVQFNPSAQMSERVNRGTGKAGARAKGRAGSKAEKTGQSD